MKHIFTTFTVITIFLSSGFAKNIVVDGFSNTDSFEKINLEVAKISDDEKSILIDSVSKEPTSKIILKTKDSLFESGKTYTATVKYTLINPNPQKLVKMMFSAFCNGEKKEQYYIGTSTNANIAKITFKIPKTSKKNWVEVQFDGEFTARLENFKIIKGYDESFISAKPNSKRFTGEIENLPTGAKDFIVQLPQPKNNIIINAADFGMSIENNDNAPALNSALKAAHQKKASKLIIPKGVYNFFSDTPVVIESFEDFTFDGNGSVFIFRREKGSANLHIRNCKRTKIYNLKMDYDWKNDPLATIVKMVGKGRENNQCYWDFDLVDYQNAGRNHELAFKQIPIANFQNWDNERRAVGGEKVQSLYFSFSTFNAKRKQPKLKWLSGNKLRVYVDQDKYQSVDYNCALNKFYRMKHMHYGLGGIEIFSNNHFTMQDVRIYSCKGHAIHINGSQQNYQFINVDILPPEDDKFRVITSTADHLHVVRSRGNFKMIDCDFALGADDCVNLHDITTFGVKSGENEITIKTRNLFKLGEEIELVESNYEPLGFKAKIIKTDYTDKHNCRIVLDKKIPTPKYDGFVMFNDNFDSSNFIARNCTFSRNRARSILLLTKNITLENCRFYDTEMGAIKLDSGFTMNRRCEGFGVKNAVVRNCVFDNTNTTDRKYQNKSYTIFMGVYLRKDPSLEQSNYPVIQDVLFENNTFNDSYGLIALISSAKNITFLNNTFSNKKSRIVKNYYRSAFYLNCASDIRFINNTWIASPLVENVGVFYDKDTVKNIIFKGNTIK